MSSLRDEAYDRIRGKLALGQLTAGSELSEPTLAAILGISRTPVREALQQLEVEGLVERNPRRKTVVRSPARHDIVDLFELREALECYAITLAAKRRTPVDLERLDFLCRELQQPVEELQLSSNYILSEAKLRRLLAADMGFHLVLIQATGNRLIMKIVADSHVLSRVFRAVPHELSLQDVSENYQVHREIYNAVKLSKATRARDLMSAHLRQTMKETLDYYEESQPERKEDRQTPRKSAVPEYLLDEFKRIGLALKK